DFGASVSISGDWAVIGSPQGYGTEQDQVGSALMYHRYDGLWTQQQPLEVPTLTNMH
ncbi:hypothetical protein KIPB_016189, partial [Kipferlia bialata]